MATKTKKSASVEAAATNAVDLNGEVSTTLFTSYGELADLGRENFAAVLRANTTLSEGLEAISKEVIGYARTSFENAAVTAAALLGAKSFEDVIQLNTHFAKTNLEYLIAGSTKLSEMGVKVASEALTPLGGRVGATIQKFVKPIAA